MRKNKLLLLLALLLTAATGAMAQDYYAPSTDEVIILNEVYNASNSGYSSHSAIAWGGSASTSNKKAGDPNNGGVSTSSTVSCYSVKGTGQGKNITLSITGVSKVIVYHERNSSRYIELRDGSKTGNIIGSGQKNTWYTEVALTATNEYSIFLHGTSGSDDADFNVYAIKLIAAADPAPAAPADPAPAAPAGYTVSLKSGVKDADKWTVKVGDGQAQALPIGGLKGDGSEKVTLQYNGRLKVKGVKATSDEKPAGPPSWKLTLSSPAKDLCIIANGGVIAQQTLDVASTEFTVEMPELTSQTVNIFATDGSGNCWYCTQENMSFAIGQTYQSSPTMTALGTESSADVYKMTAAGTIPDGKTVVLSGVNISGGSITCDGSVTMILMGANTVTATDNNAAIKIGGSGTTLTITGSGSLTAQGGLEAAGIGTDRHENGELSFGNIVINGGTVTATGGKEGAGIGTGLAQGQFFNTSITCGDITINGGTVTAIGGLYGAGIGTGPTMSDGGSASITCGDITINGGTVTATGGGFGPGIGTGVFLKYGSESASNRCGNITIGAGVTSVTATKGSSDSTNSIGKGYAYGGTQNYGTITIGGTVYATGVTASPFTYTPSN